MPSTHKTTACTLQREYFTSFVYTGGSCTASLFEEDFEEWTELPKPITLSGIAGNAKVTHGGIIRGQCINSNGEVINHANFPCLCPPNLIGTG